jgi:hypothetical protein
VSSFTINELDTITSILEGIVGLISLIFSLIKLSIYLPKNTYKCGSYIGNYKALCLNNFKVNFTYSWDIYLEGHEQEVGDVMDYLSPYIN